jgi:hypothetical protein
MQTLNIRTDSGNLELTPATQEEVTSLAAGWPMGVAFSRAEAEPNGLIFQIGEEEAYGTKLQPPDTDEQTAKALFFHNLALIASALPFYLEHRHQGIMLPCVYFKKKPNARFESGVAFFVSPHPASQSSLVRNTDHLLDGKLGAGAAAMIHDMAAAIPKASNRTNLAMNTIIGIDVRPRLTLGMLGMPFVVQGERVLAIQYPVREEHPFWAFAVRAGFSRLPYAPMIPGAVPGPPNAPHAWLERVRFLSERLQRERADG